MNTETVKCCGCDADLFEENNSLAHIIPNALGGRLQYRDLLCRDCNGILDRLADNPLVNAFDIWPTLLDIPRQRGENPPRDTITDKGHKVRVNRDGTSTRTDIVYKKKQTGRGLEVTIEAPTEKIVRQLARRDLSDKDALEAQKHERTVHLPLDEKNRARLRFEPSQVLPGALVAIWLFVIARTGHKLMSWSTLMKKIAEFQKSSLGDFRYFIDGLPGLCGPEIELGHKIVVRIVPQSGELVVYVEILGVLRLGCVLAKGPVGREDEEIYVFDVLNKVERTKEFSIDPAVFDAQDWSKVGSDDPEKIRDYILGATERLEELYRKRFGAQ